MSKEESLTFAFENDRVTFKSYLSKFTLKHQKEFELKAKKINLDSKIHDLFEGKKVNHTEDSAAWHPKYRDEYSSGSHDTPSKKNHAAELQVVRNLFSDAKNIVTLGIGGSFEGPKMLLESINLDKEETNFIFITGSDLSEFNTKTRKLKPTETIFIVSSKSFTTDETIATLKDALSWSGDINRFIAITANRKEAERFSIKNIIQFDKEIGGRYSIWSEISSLISWLSKTDFDEFMAGGKNADIDLKQNESYKKFIKNLAYSDIWFHNTEQRNSRAVLSYIWNWRSFPNYIQQLEMESLGKQPHKNSEFKKTGQIVFGGYGPMAQHSYFQLLHQGTHNICVDMIASTKDKKSLDYAQALTQSRLLSDGSSELKGNEVINGGVPINFFLIKNPSLYDLGYLIASWEHRVFVTAQLLGINPFDQFGVEAGKIYTKKYLLDID